jgi:hypothetical protein
VSIKRFNGAGLYGSKATKVWDQYTTLNDYQSIATVVVPSGGLSTITFNNIPQNFTHLQIRYSAQNNRASFATDDVIMYYNGDNTASRYQSHRIYGQGASTPASDGPNGVAGGLAGFMYSTTGGITGNFGAGIIDVFDYASLSKNKVSKAVSGADNNGGTGSGAGQIGISSSLWTPTSITNIYSITFTPGNGTLYSQFSKFALYGIKVAS